MWLYAGSYTEEVIEGLSGDGDGISVFDFDDETGCLSKKSSFPIRNSSYLCVNKARTRLYTFNEVTKEKGPMLLSYRLDGTTINLLGKCDIHGGLPCHIQLSSDEQHVFVACYETGNWLTYKVDDDGVCYHAHQNVSHYGKGPDPTRQEAPHAHQVAYVENSERVFVPDLGTDEVKVYKPFNSRYIFDYNVDLPKGSGVRHMAFHPSGKFAFASTEMRGELAMLKRIGNRFVYVGGLACLSPEFEEQPASASTVVVHQSGKFVYMGLRTGNQIAVCSFIEESESFSLLGYQSSFGHTPRDFTLSPSGKWMLVANQDSDNVVVFSIDQHSGMLKKHSELANVNSIVCLKF